MVLQSHSLNSEDWVAPVLLLIAAIVLGACVNLEIVPKDIKDTTTATVICSTGAKGIVEISDHTGDGTVHAGAPIRVDPPDYTATTYYTPGATKKSRVDTIHCNFIPDNGNRESVTADVTVRESHKPKVIAINAPARSLVGVYFNFTVDLWDDEPLPGRGHASGIDAVQSRSLQWVLEVLPRNRDLSGRAPGPPDGAKGPLVETLSFSGRCLAAGPQTLNFMVVDAAGNLSFSANRVVNCVAAE